MHKFTDCAIIMLSKPGDIDEYDSYDEIRMLISIEPNYCWIILQVDCIDKCFSIQFSE